MDGKPRDPANSVQDHLEHIRQQRSENKVFGIKDAGRWSGCKDLVEFLCQLLDVQSSVNDKFERPVRFPYLLRSITIDNYWPAHIP